jgi:DNA (cytosine-5)-methyltransferase 1
MPKKDSGLTVTDQFCGAGGSSLGISKVIKNKGGKIILALNHSKRAIETHQSNFPDTDHHCTDIQAADPRWYRSSNILVTSPECTNQTPANGKSKKIDFDLFKQGKADPEAERSRATMWDVCRFAEYHKYESIIVENVVEATTWICFPDWLRTMHTLGYNHEIVSSNSMHHHPTPQSRDRIYIVFWKKGNRKPDLNFRPKAYCPKCAHDVESVQTWKNPKKPKIGKYGKQYVYKCPVHAIEVRPYYYAAFNAIDWSNLGTKIGERKKPLSPNTMRRILKGLEKYNKDPFQTQLTRQSMALVVPWIIEMNITGEMMPANFPASTITAGGINHSIFGDVINNKGMSNASGIMDKTPTHTVQPHMGILSSFIHYNYGNDTLSGITDPAGTVSTKEKHSVVSIPENLKIEDCFYRMIFASEVKNIMAFDEDYIITGNGKEQVNQLGNAVTPPAMFDIIFIKSHYVSTG